MAPFGAHVGRDLTSVDEAWVVEVPLVGVGVQFSAQMAENVMPWRLVYVART